MTILRVLDGTERQQRRSDAVARLAADAERTVAQVARLVDIPSVLRMQAELQPTIEAVRRAEQQIAATFPSREAMDRWEPARPSPDTLARFEAVIPNTDRIYEQFRAAFEPSRRLVEQFAAMQVPARELADFAVRMDKSWSETAKQVAEQVRLSERQIDRELARLLRDRGWLGVERHLSTWELGRILEIRGRNRGKAIDKFICTVFRKKKHASLSKMTKEWWRVPYLNKRERIIRQALAAHKRKHYALSVPSLMPLVDGLAAEVRQRALPAPVANGKKVRKRLIAVGDVVTLYDPSGRVRDWVDVVIAAVSERMFKDYDFDTQQAPATVNRHGVEHGRIADYDTEVNSLQTILLLDVMAHIASHTA